VDAVKGGGAVITKDEEKMSKNHDRRTPEERLEEMQRMDAEIERSRAAEDAGYRRALNDINDPELIKDYQKKYQEVREERRQVDAERAKEKEEIYQALDKKNREQKIDEPERRRGRSR